jgi:CxxC-x17-CxxC domain-containing protein
LESEFDPEFTPQDIVNLPNYKIYLKLMIDGVTSRPFSAKTLPPMVKSGDKKIEEIVIKSSRDLYCRPKEVVEREINDWSGMSLGDYNNSNGSSSNGSLEKFPIVCSLCGLEKSVPFKPEPGRPAYCKECIAKIKSGEVKVEKRGKDQIEYDESKFYKPLADLGIEFEQKDKGKIEEDNRYHERGEKDFNLAGKSVPPIQKPSVRVDKPSNSADKPSVFGAIKKVFTKKSFPVVSPLKDRVKENLALKEVLNKINELPTKVGTPTEVGAVSLDALKNKEASPVGLQPREVKKPVLPSRGADRAATAEDMNKLKDLIKEKTEKTEVKKEEITTPAKATPPPQRGEESKTKEVPEDVLRKILE